jgi:hypothetical protein
LRVFDGHAQAFEDADDGHACLGTKGLDETGGKELDTPRGLGVEVGNLP